MNHRRQNLILFRVNICSFPLIRFIRHASQVWLFKKDDDDWLLKSVLLDCYYHRAHVFPVYLQALEFASILLPKSLYEKTSKFIR